MVCVFFQMPKPHVLLAIMWERLVHCSRPARYFIFSTDFFATGAAMQQPDIAEAKPEFEFYKLLNIIPCKEFEDICRAALEDSFWFSHCREWLDDYARIDFINARGTYPSCELSDAAVKCLQSQLDFKSQKLKCSHVMFYMAKTLTPMIPGAPKLVFKYDDVRVIDRYTPVPESEIDRNTRYVVSLGMTLIFVFVRRKIRNGIYSDCK